MGQSKRRKENLGSDDGKPQDFNEQDLERLREAFEHLQKMPDIPMEIQPIAGVMILGQLQLALRHPANTGEAAEITRTLARNLQRSICELYPPIADYLEKGWYQIFDRNPDGTPGKKAKFADLDRDRQNHILINAHALLLAATAISQMTGNKLETVSKEFALSACKCVDSSSDLELAQAIEEIDSKYEFGERT